MIHFDNEYFQPERKCDFEVDTKRKKVWAVEIDLLNQFDVVCRKYNLSYSVAHGTLLGAIRHKGFIPWDDDADVCMRRSDFEKLLRVAPEEFSEPYFLQTSYNDTKFFSRIARLRNSQTTGIIPDQASPEYNNGIYIDIYPLDGYSHNRVNFWIQCCWLVLLEKSIRVYNLDISSMQLSKKWIYVILKKTINRLFSREQLVQKYHRVIKKNNNCDRMTALTQDRSLYDRYAIYNDELNDTIDIDFENITLKAFRKYEKILEREYGKNWREFPSIEERGNWREMSLIFDPDMPYTEYFQKNIPKDRWIN